MLFILKNRNKFAHVSGSSNRMSGVLPVIALATALTLSIGTAWSYDNNVSRETFIDNLKSPSSAVVAQCVPLLNKTTNTSPPSTTARTQRTAGKVAALGLLLGVRFALEPKQDNLSVQQPLNKTANVSDSKNNRTAHAIASYRNCLKTQMLNKVALK